MRNIKESFIMPRKKCIGIYTMKCKAQDTVHTQENIKDGLSVFNDEVI